MSLLEKESHRHREAVRRLRNLFPDQSIIEPIDRNNSWKSIPSKSTEEKAGIASSGQDLLTSEEGVSLSAIHGKSASKFIPSNIAELSTENDSSTESEKPILQTVYDPSAKGVCLPPLSSLQEMCLRKRSNKRSKHNTLRGSKRSRIKFAGRLHGKHIGCQKIRTIANCKK